jgi:hypothetical protein
VLTSELDRQKAVLESAGEVLHDLHPVCPLGVCPLSVGLLGVCEGLLLGGVLLRLEKDSSSPPTSSACSVLAEFS